MFLLDLFRSLLPLHNPVGFGAADFLEITLAALLIVFTLIWRSPLARAAERFAERTGWSMLLLAVAPVALRLMLLPRHPVPSPDIYDEFSHLLVADTLRHLRLANPAHPFHRFFETFFVLQQPTYSSIYPVGQGLMLTLGWAGVLLSTAALCSLCYWMLRAWTTPGLALLGGVLAVFEFGPLNQWMNSYWGGALPAAAGCLVFGALPRLPRCRFLLGVGIAIHILTRPYESIFLILSVLLYLALIARTAWRAALVSMLVVFPAIGVTLLQNKQVTGSWTTLPYTLSQHQYGVPAALTFQPPPTPHRELTPQQAMDYKMQRNFFAGPETLRTYFARLGYRIRFYRFFFLPPLYIALAAFAFRLREARFAWVALTIMIFACGVNFFPAWQYHYVAAETCLFVLVAVTGLAQLGRWSPEAARIVVLLCFAHFLFFYSMHLFDSREDGNPERRIAIARQLAQTPGKLLIFVRYGPAHVFQEEWVWNAADIDAARVVWARDLGPEENDNLVRYYRDRKVWLLEADVRPLPLLSTYQPPPPPAPVITGPTPPPATQTLHFEPIPISK